MSDEEEREKSGVVFYVEGSEGRGVGRVRLRFMEECVG